MEQGSEPPCTATVILADSDLSVKMIQLSRAALAFFFDVESKVTSGSKKPLFRRGFLALQIAHVAADAGAVGRGKPDVGIGLEELA